MKKVRYTLASPDLYPAIEAFLLDSQSIYPGIDRWWRTRVVPGLRDGRRVCRVAVCGQQLAGLSIAKRSRGSAKFCTLRIRDASQDAGVGTNLLQQTLVDLLTDDCRAVHFTMNEGIAEHAAGFFDAYGFRRNTHKRSLYVPGADELIYVASAQRLRRAVSSATSLGDSAALLSIRPEYAELIENGRKTVEFRRRFNRHFKSGRLVIYVTSPVQEFRLHGLVASVDRGHPETLWQRYGAMAGVARQTFDRYFEQISEGVALVLSEIRQFPRPLSLRAARRTIHRFRPPVSYTFLSGNDPLWKLMVR